MLETWIQYTCNGCGETDYDGGTNSSRNEVRKYLNKHGWRHYPGNLDYCENAWLMARQHRKLICIR